MNCMQRGFILHCEIYLFPDRILHLHSLRYIIRSGDSDEYGATGVLVGWQDTILNEL